jgi:predicted metalloprotease with PDZ domain
MQSTKLAVAFVTLSLLAAGEAYAGYPMIGATGSHLPQGGFLIEKVFPGLPAQYAGLEPGDVLVAINGMPIRNPQQYSALLGSAGAAATFTVRNVRDGRNYNFNIALVDSDVVQQRLHDQIQALRRSIATDVEVYHRARDARIWFQGQTAIGILNNAYNLYP